MANQSLESILNVEAADGPFSVGDAVLEQTLRDFIQLQSNTIAIATDLVGVRSVPWLEFTWYTGINGTFDFPLDDVALTDPTKVGTANYTTKLEKGQGRVTFLDAVRLRGETWENIDRQQLAIVRGRADKIDNKILTDLMAGSGNSDVATGGGNAKWGGTSADEEGNVLSAMDAIFANGKVSGNEPLAMVVPADKRSALLNTTLYGNVVESLADHLARIASLRIYYTRDIGSGSAMGDDALLMVPGAETAEFFTYNGAGFQETELTRIPGLGFDWMLTSYMGSVIHEHQDDAAGGKNMRMCKITTVR